MSASKQDEFMEPDPDEYAVRLTMEMPADDPKHARDILLNRLIHHGADDFYLHVTNVTTGDKYFVHGNDIVPEDEAIAEVERLDRELAAATWAEGHVGASDE